MTDHQPNHKRNRPSVSFTLPREQIDFIRDTSKRAGKSKSVILEDIINFVMVGMVSKPNPLVQRIMAEAEEGEEM